jgi:hypothetical protein
MDDLLRRWRIPITDQCAGWTNTSALLAVGEPAFGQAVRFAAGKQFQPTALSRELQTGLEILRAVAPLRPNRLEIPARQNFVRAQAEMQDKDGQNRSRALFRCTWH